MTITDNNNDNTITSNDNCDKNSNDQINKHNYIIYILISYMNKLSI